MSTEAFADFLRDIGHTVIKDDGVWWHDVSPRVFVSFPFDRAVDPDAVRNSKLLGRQAVAARFLSSGAVGRPSWTIICRDEAYDMESLGANARSKVRRGLKSCQVRPLRGDELIASGLTVCRATHERQQRPMSAKDEAYWQRHFSTIVRLKSADVWGAFVGGSLAAFSIAVRMEGTAHMLVLRSTHDGRACYANNALVFSYLYHAMREQRLDAVSFGWEPIQGALPGLIEFKESMGFRREPATQAIALAGWLDRMVRGPLGSTPARRQVARLLGERGRKLGHLVEWARDQESIRLSR